jgi:hypothetical protein
MGEGMAFGTLVFGVTQVAITAICQKSFNNGKIVTMNICIEKHKGTERELSGIRDKLNILDANQMKNLEAVTQK